MNDLPDIRVASIQLAQKLIEQDHFDWIISIGHQGRGHVVPPKDYSGCIVLIDVNDLDEFTMARIEEEGGRADEPPTAARLGLAVVLAPKMEGRVLVHCHGGWCRAPAVALGIIATRLGHGREKEAVEHLAAIHPPSTPNSLIVRIFDDLLQREGALYQAFGEQWPNCLPPKDP